MNREDFKEAVFKRDKRTCVFCKLPAVDAHHILERKLWADGGYYLDNGASVCSNHHSLCEQTNFSVEEVRRACGITNIIVPPQLEQNQAYDKWGNPILASGQRLRGELFSDPGCQLSLRTAGVLHLFTHLVKYPRTYHLPWSKGISNNDKVQKSLIHLEGRRVIVTEKMDGENTTLYSDYMHARSIDGRSHPSRDWLKQLWSKVRNDIPEGWRVCGENLYAKHSIEYSNLLSYFLGYSIWNEANEALDWDETLEWFQLLGVTPVSVLFDGLFDEKKIRSLCDDNDKTREGYVVRVAKSIHYSEFKNCVGKFVRKDHVQTDEHWMQSEIVPNRLKIS